MSWTTLSLTTMGYLLQYGNNGSFNSTLLPGAAPQGATYQYVVGGLVDKANYTLRMLAYCDICIPSVWSVVSFVIAGESTCVCDVVMMVMVNVVMM